MRRLRRPGFQLVLLILVTVLAGCGPGFATVRSVALPPPGGLHPAPPPPTANVTEAPAPAPVGLVIPALGVDVPLYALDREPDGTMGAPTTAAAAGWDGPGSAPGSPGNALIAAHRDFHGRLGPFWRLQALKPGDVIQVRLQNGEPLHFAVAWVRSYDTERPPLGEIFASSSEPVLTLITCGGLFDRSRRDYLERVVVRAFPVHSHETNSGGNRL